MLKVSLAREYHRYPVFVRTGDYFIILIRAARLNYARYARPGGIFNIIREREKRVRSHRTILHLVACVPVRNQPGLNSIHLPGPNA
jgi:hypothetical protein